MKLSYYSSETSLYLKLSQKVNFEICDDIRDLIASCKKEVIIDFINCDEIDDSFTVFLFLVNMQLRKQKLKLQILNCRFQELVTELQEFNVTFKDISLNLDWADYPLKRLNENKVKAEHSVLEEHKKLIDEDDN